MAVKYFDLNGATAGFGTLTGAWNTSSAFWSDSSAGTATPAAYTFTDQDTAQFGFAGTTATAGTATIAASLNVTVNKVVTANLAAVQTIAAGAGGTLTLAGTSPTINVGSVGGLTISAPITGTAGFTKAGAETLTLSNTAGNTGLTAGQTITLTAGRTALSTGTGTLALANNYVFSIPNAGTSLVYYYFTAATSAVAAGTTYSGNGFVEAYRGTNNAATTLSFPAGAFEFLTGTAAAAANVPQSGLSLQVDGTANGSVNDVTVSDLPGVVSYRNVEPGAVATTTRLRFAGSGTNYSTRIDLITNSSSSPGSSTQEFYANNATGLLTLTEGVQRIGTAAAMTLTLRGTGAGGAVLSGIVAGASLNITKADSTRWVLSGANTYTGGTTISAGFLRAASAGALGSSTTGVVTLASGATLEFSGDVTVNKASVAINLNGGGVTNVSGDNAYSGATSPMAASTTFTATAGSLSWSPTLSGAFPIIKAGTGALKLNNTANTYTGTTTINVGTLEVTKLALVAVNSSIGAPVLANATISMAAGTTFKHTGTGTDSTDRIIAVSSVGTLTLDSSDATNTGSVNFTTGGTVTWQNGANTLVLSGTNTNTGNTFARTLADTTGTTSVTKSGAGYWKLTSTMTGATGPVTVSAGTLDLGSTANRAFGGTLAIAGGTLTNGAFTIQPTTSITASGGTVTSVLTGAGVTFTATSGTTSLRPNNASKSNTFTGAVTIQNTAIVDLIADVAVSTGSNGKVLGTGNVTVQNGGTLRTGAAGSQVGQARYNNLTFNGGSTLRIGFAA